MSDKKPNPQTDPYRENTYEQPKPNQARDELELLAVRGRMEKEEKQRQQEEAEKRAQQEAMAAVEARRREAPLKEQAAAKARLNQALSHPFEFELSAYVFFSSGIFLFLWQLPGLWLLLFVSLFIGLWAAVFLWLHLRKRRVLAALCKTPWSTSGVEEVLSAYVSSGAIEVRLQWREGHKKLEDTFVKDLFISLGIEATLLRNDERWLFIRSPKIDCTDSSGEETTYQNRSLFQWIWGLRTKLLHRLHNAYGIQRVSYELVERKKTIYD